MPDAGKVSDERERIIRSANCWQLLNMMTSNFGSLPAGQIMIALTIDIFHRNDYSMTVTELSRATGLPNSSVTRYVSWQLGEGYLEEIIDPDDRRLRRLMQTKKGLAEMAWLDNKLEQVERESDWIAERFDQGMRKANSKKILERMTEAADAAERRFLI
jgi:DNA-binding MarR family transcriptional regulator